MKLKKGCSGWLWILPVLIADRLCKMWTMRIPAHHGWVEIIPGILTFGYAENRGMAFGLAQGRGWLLIGATSIIIVALILYLLFHPDEPRLLRTGLWLLIGGGLGNLYDRIAYGYVLDFIRLDFIDFPLFNIADIAVCTGVGLAALSIVLMEKRRRKG